MIKLFFGSIAAAVAMFITGFIFFATPLGQIAYSGTGEAQSAAVQTALAANLPTTGTYLIPDPSTQSGTTLYGKGPVAMVHYNSHGFSLESVSGVINGFILDLVVAVLLAGALSTIDRRIPDFSSRAKIVVLFSVAASALICLGDPIWLRQDWRYSLYAFVGDAAMLIVAGLVLVRWFMPVAAEMPTPAAAPLSNVEQAQEPASS